MWRKECGGKNVDWLPSITDPPRRSQPQMQKKANHHTHWKGKKEKEMLFNQQKQGSF